MSQPLDAAINRTATARELHRKIADERMIAAVIQRGREFSEPLKNETADGLFLLTGQLKERVRASHRHPNNDEAVWELLTNAIAVVQEAIRRELSLEPFDTQLRAGIVMSLGGIAEMQTGEGKTLAGVLPAYVNALRGKGVHVATPNAYLARRDFEHLRGVFRHCGMTTGVVELESDDEQARQAYRADITYGSAHTFGFDYLRDQIASQKSSASPIGSRLLSTLRGVNTSRRRQRGLACAIVDEADDVLLDDAVSPLILSETPNGPAPDAPVHQMALAFVDQLSEGEHFFASGSDQIELTDEGFAKTYADTAASTHPDLMRPWHEYVITALRAAYHYARDVHYIVRDDSIELIDRATGRVFADRSWSGGLHQAVQAREGLEITNESVALGRITKQSFFRSYRHLTGMTGTADQCQRELEQVYGTPVETVPLRIASKRETYTPRFVLTQDDKYEAVVNEAFSIAVSGRPVLVGTLSVSESLAIASRLREFGRPFEILNGVQDADEAAVVATAGRSGAITVATNLAGRGTDIKLDDRARECGGLHVIVTQMHPFARVDRQLIGRAARCGDPGSCRFFIAADDPLLLQHAPWITRHLRRVASENTNAFHPAGSIAEDPRRDHRLFNQIVTVQRRLQREASSRRLQMLKTDLREQEILSRATDQPDACWAI
ncbi:MAG: DEAD/DEAH box helicase [Rhodopirellula sp. JB044]|uniref:preprotein translocase subunit SecA n=1 Tax=Rhodopirellula sp. JB044 TaxID=3342844 RepID=UPI00370BB3CD